MDVEMINKELTRFNLTDTAIAKMSEEYMALTVKGLEDKDGLAKVHKARIDVKGRRVAVTKTGKELREDAVNYQRMVLTEEKRILALISPIEDHLISEENKIQAEKDRITKEAEEKEAARIQSRINRLEDLGMVFSRGRYVLPFEQNGDNSASEEAVRTVADDGFENFCQGVIEAVSAENGRKQRAEADKKAEEERLAGIAAEQEVERRRLEEIAQKNAEMVKKMEMEKVEAEKALEAERKAIEAERKALADAKQKEIDDKLRAEEIEKAKTEAAEKARIEAEERAKKEAEEKERLRIKAIEDERLAKIAEEEEDRIQEELKPDKKKLLELADGIEAIHGPLSLKFDASKKILEITLLNLKETAKVLRESVKKIKGGR